MTQYADNIRRIVGLKDIAEANKSYDDKAKINGNRSIAYIDNTGTVKQTTGAKAGVDEEGNEIPGATIPDSDSEYTPDETGNNPDDATTGGSGGGPGSAGGPKPGPQNPNVVSSTQGVYDIADLIDGLGGPGLPEAGDIASVLKGLSGLNDCTGNTLNIRFDGEFIPPPGWDTVDSGNSTPGADGEYVAGYYYEVGGLGPPWPPERTVGADLNIIAENLEWGFLEFGYVYTYVAFFTQVTSTSWSIYAFNPGSGTNQVFSTVYRQPCPDSYGICAAGDPGLSWPRTGAITLSFSDIDNVYGFFGYELDPIIPLAYQPTTSGGAYQPTTVPFCFGSGRFGRIEPTKTGGYMIMETTGSSSGTPTGNIRVFSKSGVLQGYATASNYAAYKPN